MVVVQRHAEANGKTQVLFKHSSHGKRAWLNCKPNQGQLHEKWCHMANDRKGTTPIFHEIVKFRQIDIVQQDLVVCVLLPVHEAAA